MSNILVYHKVLYILLACTSFTLLAIATWTLADPVVRAFYYNLTIKDDRLPNKADTWNFFIISIVSVVASVQFIVISILALWVNGKRMYLFRIVTWYNVLLFSFTVAGIVLVATNRDVSNRFQLRDVLSHIMKYKEAMYGKSVEDSTFMDIVQQTVGCCGVLNADVYVTNNRVPLSCGKMYGVGCLEKSLTYLDTRLRIFGGIYGVILILQIATLFVSCFVPTKTKKKSTSSWSPVSQRSKSPYSLRY